uniref:Uncharacterized protein n=1 Tax=Equus asinus TaxID=9793 RepID=A0A8C4L655_EQUAS
MREMASKKSKKSWELINSRLQLLMKSRKCMLRYKQTLKAIRQALRKCATEHYAMLAKLVSITTVTLTLNWA